MADLLGADGPGIGLPPRGRRGALVGATGSTARPTGSRPSPRAGPSSSSSTSGFLSSREAEDHLVRLGDLPGPHPEPAFAGDPSAAVLRVLGGALPKAGPGDILLANSGANAVYAAFRAVSELQAARGRTVWIQLGWLYLDTIAILRKFTAGASDYLHHSDVLDRAGLERLFAEHGPRIAGLVTEIPTNPLIQTPDVAALSELCRRHGAALILDPSVASPFTVDVLPHADLVVASLTKYTASDGDVIAGLLAVNPAGPLAAELRSRAAGWLEPVYPRDLSRLASQIGRDRGDPGPDQRRHPEGGRLPRRASRGPGGLLGPQALDAGGVREGRPVARGRRRNDLVFPPGSARPFYDRLRLAKGPSFGMQTTLICPFMYLAHYDLVTSEAGRAELARNGLDPELLRLCVGAEPVEEIIAALAEALG